MVDIVLPQSGHIKCEGSLLVWENKFTKYIILRPAQFMMLLGDVLTMQLMLLLVVALRLVWGDITLSLYVTMSSILWCAPIFSILFGACQIPMPPPHREVKHIFLMVSLTYLVVLLFLFMTQSSVGVSRAVLLLAWIGSIFAVPMVRGVMRRRLCRKAWWGCPTIFLQDEEGCSELWQELVNYPERGLRPVAYLNIDTHDKNWQQKIVNIQNTYVNPIFIWCGSDGEVAENSEIFEKITRFCSNVLFIPCDKVKKKKFWLAPRVLGTSMGFLVRQNLTDARRLCIKRCIDILFSLLSLVVVVPLAGVIILWVRISTGSSAIYTQDRWGQGGKKIRVYKFRTMVPNADAVLQKYLNDNPEARKEWDANLKLVDDPRITTVGRFLRKTSLDELPQIINVIQGNMSLVGPRPILEEEMQSYGEVFLNYTEVKPGITGLWQISGRNLTTYEQRVWYVNYYVTNWSLWMDLWIMARTIPVVLRGHGAY